MTVPRTTIALARRLLSRHPNSGHQLNMIGSADCAADDVRSLRYRADVQMSIFSAISIASSTSMPR